MSVPAGVRTFGFTKTGSPGKFQPPDLSHGPDTVEYLSGGASQPKPANASHNATPAGVTQHSGTENFVTVVHKNASHSGPAKKAGVSATPEGVRAFDSCTPKLKGR